MQTNDDVRHLTIKCQETQTKLDRALEELAARPAATKADNDDVAELKRALEEQFQVLDEMRAKLTASEQRAVELEAENELLLERLAELEIAAEERGGGQEPLSEA
jgi:chromosome segregation ATPase